MRNMRKVILAGFFWAASTMAGGNAPAVSETGAVSTVAGREGGKDVAGSDSGAAPLPQRKAKESLVTRKMKKAAQASGSMLSEKQLGLGCAQP